MAGKPLRDKILRGKPSKTDPDWVIQYREWWNRCAEAEKKEKEKRKSS